MDYKEIRQKQKENKENLEHAKDVLIKISKKPKNSKFEKMPLSDVYRAKMLQRDNKEKIPKFKRYKRGTIIFVDFGIGVGYEFSHPHFAIVLDNKDNPNKGTLTVIPLTSKNKNSFIDLGKNLINEIINKISNDVSRINDLIYSIHDLYRNPILKIETAYYPNDKHIQKTLTEFAQRHNCEDLRVESSKFNDYIEKDKQYVEEILNFYKKYDKNTYANPQAITTISKFRIMNQKNPLDPIGRVQISKESMNKIENQLIKNILKVKLDKNIK